MSILRRLIGTDEATTAHRLVQLWEEKIKPDLLAEIKEMKDDGLAMEPKDVKATVRAFLDRADSRVTARANESMSRGRRKTVKKTATVETTEVA